MRPGALGRTVALLESPAGRTVELSEFPTGRTVVLPGFSGERTVGSPAAYTSAGRTTPGPRCWISSAVTSAPATAVSPPEVASEIWVRHPMASATMPAVISPGQSVNLSLES